MHSFVIFCALLRATESALVLFVTRFCVGRDSSVGISTRYGLNGPRIESQWGGARFSAPVQTCAGAHPASYTLGTGSFPGSRAAGAWRCPPIPSSAEVKERVQLYLYSPSGSSWPVIGRTLSLPFPVFAFD